MQIKIGKWEDWDWVPLHLAAHQSVQEEPPQKSCIFMGWVCVAR